MITQLSINSPSLYLKYFNVLRIVSEHNSAPDELFE